MGVVASESSNEIAATIVAVVDAVAIVVVIVVLALFESVSADGDEGRREVWWK